MRDHILTARNEDTGLWHAQLMMLAGGGLVVIQVRGESLGRN